MNEVKGLNTNENRLIVEIQKAIGAYANGIIGTQTLSDIANKVGAGGFPYTLNMYGCPTIIAKDILVCDPNSSVRSYDNSISGSFTWPPSGMPCSILINQGKDIFSYACHQHKGKPEGVIARYRNGTFWSGRCINTSEIPDRGQVKWAVGGLTLGAKYSPSAEGFSGSNADVLRQTNHTVLGVKNGLCYLVYFANKTGATINGLAKNKFLFEHAILLDGGHIAAINGTESFAEINMNQYQGYIIQGV